MGGRPIIQWTLSKGLAKSKVLRLFCDVGGIQLLILDPFYPEMEQQIARQRIDEHYFRSISRTSLSGGG